MKSFFNAAAAGFLLILLLSVELPQRVSSTAFGLDRGSPLRSESQSLQDLFESEYAVLRIQGNQAKVAGVGFVIRQAPIRILTCNHVVSEGTEQNEGPIIYAIARRTESTNDVDTRRVSLGYLKVKHISFKPEYDIAILEIDPSIDEPIAERLHVKDSKPLTLNLEGSQRSIGSPVTWITTAAQGDVTLTPRLFTGDIVANYIADQKYTYSSSGKLTDQVMAGARMLEIDKLFIPGASGSPILNSNTKQVIGYVHGYRTFALNANVDVTEEVEVGDSALRKQKLRYKPPLVTSISLGIDLRTAERYLVDEGYVRK